MTSKHEKKASYEARKYFHSAFILFEYPLFVKTLSKSANHSVPYKISEGGYLTCSPVFEEALS